MLSLSEMPLNPHAVNAGKQGVQHLPDMRQIRAVFVADGAVQCRRSTAHLVVAEDPGGTRKRIGKSLDLPKRFRGGVWIGQIVAVSDESSGVRLQAIEEADAQGRQRRGAQVVAERSRQR